MIATVALEKSDIGISLYHRVSSALKVASKLTLAEKKNSIAFATEYALDKSTTVKGKLQVNNDQSYLLGGYVCHKLAEPAVVVSLSSVCESAGKAPVFGCNIAFGDN